MEDKIILAIDQSTQGTKVIAFSLNHKIIWKGTLTHKQIISSQGWVSHNLFEIKNNLYTLLKKALAVVPQEKIIALAITNQRETTAAWSRKTGDPLALSIVWQCARAKQIIDKLSTLKIKKYVKQVTGLQLSPYFSAAKFAWMIENEPNVKKAAQEQDLCLGTIDSWLLYQLTDKQSFKTEPSNACRTQLMNIRKINWDKQICETFKIPIESLPQIVDSNSIFGTTNLFGLLDNSIPITSILGDSQAALYAHHCLNKGNFKVTFGTGSSVMINIGNQLPNQLPEKLNTSIAWKINGQVNYVLEGNINYAGACVTWLKDNLNIIDNPNETEKMAKEANKDDQTILIPAFDGLGAPYWITNMKAAFVNMSRTTGKKELVKATLNSLAFQINDILSEFKKVIPELSSTIHVDGGMIHNNYLMQFLSNITQKEIQPATISELSALGSAMNSVRCKDVNTYSNYFKPNISKNEASKAKQNWNKWIRIFSSVS